ncbi:MAG: DUF4870 domain-containing protein [Fimbriimonadaceae bacterium]|nr:DUF4870 domain-containing protein [Fimbriimonadaceae bacterium]
MYEIRATNPEDRLWAMLAHIVPLVLSSTAIGGIISALVIYLLKKESPFVRYHAKQQILFQVAVVIVAFIGFLLTFALVGIPILMVLGIYAIVMPIIAAINAYKGEYYALPIVGKMAR